MNVDVFSTYFNSKTDTFPIRRFDLTIEQHDNIKNIKYGKIAKEGDYFLDSRKDRVAPLLWETRYWWACGGRNCSIKGNAEFIHNDELGKEELFKIDVSWLINDKGKITTINKICINNDCGTTTNNNEQIKIGRYSLTLTEKNSIILVRDDLTSIKDEFKAINQKYN